MVKPVEHLNVHVHVCIYLCKIDFFQIHSEVMAVVNHIGHSKDKLPEDMCKYVFLHICVCMAYIFIAWLDGNICTHTPCSLCYVLDVLSFKL